jgi:hypothetical protein
MTSSDSDIEVLEEVGKSYSMVGIYSILFYIFSTGSNILEYRICNIIWIIYMMRIVRLDKELGQTVKLCVFSR